MRTWLGPFCDACGAWAARTGLPEHLVAGPLLDYTGGYRREQTESSIDAMRAWFERLQRETGMHDHFLVFAAIKATESFLAVWVARLPEEHARARQRVRTSPFATADLAEEQRRRQSALDAWRELALPILSGTQFGAGTTE